MFVFGGLNIKCRSTENIKLNDTLKMDKLLYLINLYIDELFSCVKINYCLCQCHCHCDMVKYVSAIFQLANKSVHAL